MRTSAEGQGLEEASPWFHNRKLHRMEQGARGLVMPTHVPRGRDPAMCLSRFALPDSLPYLGPTSQCSLQWLRQLKACQQAGVKGLGNAVYEPRREIWGASFIC